MINFVYSFNNCNKSHNYLGVLDCAEHIVMSLNVILCKKKKGNVSAHYGYLLIFT